MLIFEFRLDTEILSRVGENLLENDKLEVPLENTDSD
jgi:hypothetical protein